MKKFRTVLLVVLLVVFLLILWNPFFIHLPGVLLGKISPMRHGKPFLEAHERAVNSFVKSKGFGFGRFRKAELWNEQSVELHGKILVPEHIRLIGVTAEYGGRYFKANDAPPKEMIQTADWRSLSGWEIEAIEQLKSGEPFVVQQSENGPEASVRIIAPMFARTSCLQCHDVNEGELLGALDYQTIEWSRSFD